MKTDRRAFWEEKIVGWEDGRYARGGTRSTLFERIADRTSASLRYRLAAAREILLPNIEARSVVEIGCGSAFLAPDLIRAGARKYTGYDIAQTAVERAGKIAREAGVAEQTEFHRNDVLSLGELDADVIFSLGLLDWLDDGELDHLFRISGKALWLHAISERRFSPAQWLHRLYVHVAYGHRTGGYAPRYHAVGEVEAVAWRYNPQPVRVIRDPGLGFGALLSTIGP